MLALLLVIAPAVGQSLDEQLDEQAYLDGLVSLRLPEVLEQYVADNPTDDPVRRAIFDIARGRMELADPRLPPGPREQIVQQLGTIRRGLIRRDPHDTRRAGWMIDHASDLWFEVLPLEASGLTAVIGTAAGSQRERAARVAGEMNELTAVAEIEIDAALRALESRPGFAGDFALRRRRARLATVERDQRIPFFRGVAALLHAEVNVEDENVQRELREIAAELLVPLGDSLSGRPAVDALLHGGLALARLGDLEGAAAALERAARHPDATDLDRFAAAMGEVIALEATGQVTGALARLSEIERGPPREADVLARLLIADRRAVLYEWQARDAAPQEQSRLRRAAVDGYLALLDDGPGGASAALEAAVRARLQAAATAGLRLDALPPMVAIARAADLAHDAGSRDEAIILLEAVLARADVPARDRVEAEFELARARLMHGDVAAAADAFIALARAHPAQRRAEEAIEIGLAAARDLHERNPTDVAARKRLRDALALLLERYPNLRSIDAWRAVAATLALEERRFDEALLRLRSITPEAEGWADAVYLQAVVHQAWLRDEMDAAAKPERGRALLEQVARSSRLLTAGLDEMADPGERQRRRRHLAGLRIIEAEARREMGDADAALSRLEGIESTAGLDVATIGEALRARILAYRQLGRPAEAVAEARRLVERAPDDAESVLSSLVATLRADAEDLLALSRDDDAAALAADALVPLAQVLESHLAARRRGPVESWEAWRGVADAYRLGARPRDARVIYEAMLETQPDDLATLAGHAECLYALGDEHLAEAMLVFRRIAAAGAETAGSSYWLSQLRMLQILDRTGRNTHKITPRILRLRREDPELGGERWRRGFERLQGKYS